MSYEAKVARIHVREHPNADRLALGAVAGYQVVTSKDTPSGELGIFFPSDGQLSHEFCYNNNEYRISSTGPVGENIDKGHKGGYFEANRRVRTISLRGQKSEGYWVPLSTVEFTGVNTALLCEGDTFTELNGVPICNKYVTPATERALKAQKQGKARKNITMFKEHTDTKKLRYTIDFIPDGARLTYTEKCHGTSGRTGHVEIETSISAQPWYRRFLYWLLGQENTYKWEHVSGSRRVVLQNRDDGFYDTNFRQAIHSTIALRKCETIYYEIVGYEPTGKPIMGRHSLQAGDEVHKRLRKLYGESMTYSYGCEPGCYRILVYRITVTNPDGDSWDLSWDQVRARAAELGLQVVPELGQSVFRDIPREQLGVGEVNKESLLELCERLTTGHSTLCRDHIIEGVCIRIDHPSMIGVIRKYKGFDFCHLEGIAKNSEDYVDVEESS